MSDHPHKLCGKGLHLMAGSNIRTWTRPDGRVVRRCRKCHNAHTKRWNKEHREAARKIESDYYYRHHELNKARARAKYAKRKAAAR